MSLADDLYAIEHELALGDDETYDRHLAEHAVVVVPGRALDRADTVAAMAASPGWDDVTLDERSVIALADSARLLSYRFTGRRGETRYEALMGSVYVDRDGAWKLAYHQQTPLGY